MKITKQQLEQFIGENNPIDELLDVVNGDYTLEGIRKDINTHLKIDEAEEVKP